MDIINDHIIQLLIRERNELCVSAYMPAHRAWNDTDQDLLRFKNLIKKTEKELTDRDIPATKKEKFLKPLRDLQNNTEFWRYQQEGLALFATANEFYYVKLPITFEDEIFIGDQFHILPLIPALTETFDFYALLLDQKNMKLYRSHHYTLEPVPVNDMPKDVDEALAFDNPGRNLQNRNYPGMAGGGANFHGHGVDTDASRQKENIIEYFRKADDAISKIIGDDVIPLVLAGVEYHHALYREANTYHNLYPKGITKKMSMKEQELYSEVKNLLDPYFKRVQQDALALYGNLASGERASDDLKEIVTAAFSKRISHLFINPKEKRWGSMDFKEFEVKINNERKNGDIELLGLAVTQTIKNNGLVYLLDEAAMPNSKPAAAIFRY